jgi:hypothetical protein
MDDPHSALWRHLRKIGLLPEHTAVMPRQLTTGVDLVPLLRAAWDTPKTRPRTTSHRRRHERLTGEQYPPPSLTYGLPGTTSELVRDWIGERLVWWPHAIASRPWMSIVSSRLGRPLYEQVAWFAKLRAACEFARTNGDTLVFASNTTTARFLARCGQLYQIPTLRLEVAPEKHSVERWLKHCLEIPELPNDKGLQQIAYISPALDGNRQFLKPIRDALAVAASDRLVALHVRPNGHIEQLLRRRGSCDVIDEASTESGSWDQVSPRRSPRTSSSDGLDSPFYKRPAAPPGITKNASLIPADQIPPDRLLHWTRQHNEPWPDESLDRYLDALILQLPEADHSALATLRRIVLQQKLQATSNTIRGGYPVVCFSATPVMQLSRKRIFRPHRGRWDFERFGICIDRGWLDSIGTRPVLYGDDSLWNRMSGRERPFFQKHDSDAECVDWTLEQEWRHVGDVDLSGLSPEAAALFVPRVADAERMIDISPWPIAVLEA